MKKRIVSLVALTVIGLPIGKPILSEYAGMSSSESVSHAYLGDYSRTTVSLDLNLIGSSTMELGETRTLEYKTTYTTLTISNGGLNRSVSSNVSSRYNPSEHYVSSSDEKVAKIDSNGNVVAVSPGQATITAKVIGTNTKEMVDINVIEVQPKSIELNNNNIDIERGEVTQLSATVKPSNAVNKEVIWTTSDAKVATVDAKGNIKTVDFGTAKITATVKGTNVKAYADINVKDKAKSISMNKAKVELDKGTQEKLIATVMPENSINNKVEWTSSDAKVATVDSTGKITAVGIGKAKVTATVKGTDIETTTEVTTVIRPKSIEVNKNKMILEKGTKEKLTARVSPMDAQNKEIVWSTSDEKIAKIDSEGNVVALGAGKATVIAKVKGTDIKATSEVIVTVKPVSVKLDKAKIEIEKGQKNKLTATVSPVDATNKDIVWATSDTEVATVDASGNVVAVGAGNATVTATVKGTDNKATSEVIVTVKPVSVKLDKAKIEIEKGQKNKLTATVSPVDATNKDIVWTTSDTKVATVDASGNVAAVGAGNVTVTATVKGTDIKATSEVAVGEILLKLDKEKVELATGEKDKLVATVSPTNPTNKDIEWSSSDENVVKVDANGNIEAVGAGTAKVIAKVKGTDITAETEIVVTEKEKPVDTTTKFTDIDGHWAKAFVEHAFTRGLFKGTTETLFSPDSNMTRGMFVTVLGRLAGETAEPNDKFSDVNSEVYYAKYIAWAEENGIVEGYGNGEFGPDNNVTREEMAAIIERYMEYKKINLEDNNTAEFVDNDEVSEWAKESVAKIQKAGIIEGKGNGIFDPQANSTRAEVATLLIRMIEKYID